MESLEKMARFAQELDGVKAVESFETMPSTNSAAMELGKAGAESGTLVVANQQTAGRGRLGRRWESPADKGLYFSLILRPQLLPNTAAFLTLATGLALKRALEEQGVESIILKWPNDVLIQKKKVAGILAEMQTRGKDLDFVVLGIGINVLQEVQDFPTELQDQAGSLKMLSGKTWDRAALLKQVLAKLFAEVEALETENSQRLIERWQAASSMIGKPIQVEWNGETKTGRAKGLTTEGHLLLEEENGNLLTLIAGDTRLL